MAMNPSLTFALVLSLALCLSFVNSEQDESNLMAPDHFPSWATALDKRLLDSNPEALKRKANIVVAKDGTGRFKTVKEAVDAAPEKSKTHFIIYVKRGVYNEITNIPTSKTYLTLVGDGIHATILTGRLSNKTGYSIMQSATLAVNADGFMAQDIRVQNTAGPTENQAVALRVTADMTVIYRCRIDGYQDTLYAHQHRQFYRQCLITGTIDFICGDAAAVFQECVIQARKPLPGQSNMLTAQARTDPHQPSGFMFQKCHIRASSDLARVKGTVKTFLGRPWRMYSSVAVVESFIDDLIDPAGWAPWNNDPTRLSTLIYREYNNKGLGADTSRRVKWKGFKALTNPTEVVDFTVLKLLSGNLWLNSTGVPYEEGL